MVTGIGQSGIRRVGGRLKQHKTESATISLAIILAVLCFVFSTIPDKVCFVLLLPNALIFLGKVVYLAIRNSKSFKAFRIRMREIKNWIDDDVSRWIREWFQVTTRSPNVFFEWLLPGVNVNVACAENDPHDRVNRYRHRGIFPKTCLYSITTKVIVPTSHKRQS
jgi:hypothetical protein